MDGWTNGGEPGYELLGKWAARAAAASEIDSAGTTIEGFSVLKVMLHVRRKEGMSRAEFRDYYESTHAPLAASMMKHCVRYVRNFVIEEPGSPQDFDVVTEFWMDVKGDPEAIAKQLDYESMAAVLEADEARFMDRSSMRVVIVDECETDPRTLLGHAARGPEG